jgi:hypothetical protein
MLQAMERSLRLEAGRAPGLRRGSAPIKTVLSLGALAIAVLPGPLLALGVLPAYQAHARFLAFYTPFVCLLILAYLFYVRDYLARIMFARVLRPAAEGDDYYDPYRRRSVSRSVGRGLRRSGTVLIALFPALLLGSSFYSITRYLTVLDESVAVARSVYGERFRPEEEVGFTQQPTGRQPPSRRRASTDSASTSKASGRTARPDSLPPPEDSSAVRSYVLHSSNIDDIPLFQELTVLYIGAFGAACVAVVIMALKEHAKEAMGLSEQDLMLGRPTSGVD